jgi:hypothetical protein
MPVVVLKRVRLQYGDLHRRGKPNKDKPNEPGKYAANGIMEEGSEAFKTAYDAFLKAAQETFGANWQAVIEAMEKSSKCIRKGNQNLDQSGNVRVGFADKMYIVAKNPAKPAIVDSKVTIVDGKPVYNYLTEEDGKPYNGCWVNLKVDIYAMKAKGDIKAGVFAKLMAVQFVENGEAFGSAPGTPDGFEDEGDSGGSPAAAATSGANLF